MQMPDGSTRMHPAERGLMPNGLGQSYRIGAQQNTSTALGQQGVAGAGHLPGQRVGQAIPHAGINATGPAFAAGMKSMQGRRAYGRGGPASGSYL